MSRSRKKHNFASIYGAQSEREDKQLWHRAYRRVCNTLISQGVHDMPNFREHSNVWAMAKDGKFLFDPVTHPQLKRK